MKYLLIVFVVFLALAPLSHFVPSKRQRQIARLREYAAVHGLFVELRQPPGRSAATSRQASERVIYYGKRLPYGDGTPIKRGAWVLDEQEWRPVNWRDPVPEALLQLPPQAYAASVDEGSCGVFWDERGEEKEVDSICAALEGWTRQLRPPRGDFA